MLDEIKLPQAVDALSALQNLAGTRQVEVELPILQTKAMVRPVDGSEELRLRTMKASGAAFITPSSISNRKCDHVYRKRVTNIYPSLVDEHPF